MFVVVLSTIFLCYKYKKIHNPLEKAKKRFLKTREKWYNRYMLFSEGGVKMKSKRDIYISMSSDLNFTKYRSKEAVDYIFDKIGEYLSEGEKVQLRGFGNFEVRERAEHKGRNPQTGKTIIIKSIKAPVFKSGTALKELVNNKYSEEVYEKS